VAAGAVVNAAAVLEVEGHAMRGKWTRPASFSRGPRKGGFFMVWRRGRDCGGMT
jgi:hypothetical protein